MAEANANAGIARGQVLHGARGWVSLNGRPVGYCQSINVNTTIQRTPVDVLDNIETEEHVPTAYSVNGSIGVLGIVDKTLVARGIETDLGEILTRSPLTITISDRPTDKAVWTLEGVSVSGAGFTLQKGVLTAHNCSFVAIRKRDSNGVVC